VHGIALTLQAIGRAWRPWWRRSTLCGCPLVASPAW